jgi:hypothetical protein
MDYLALESAAPHSLSASLFYIVFFADFLSGSHFTQQKSALVAS